MSPACWLGEHDRYGYEWKMTIVPSELTRGEVAQIRAHKNLHGRVVFDDIDNHTNGASWSHNWTRSGTWRIGKVWTSR